MPCKPLLIMLSFPFTEILQDLSAEFNMTSTLSSSLFAGTTCGCVTPKIIIVLVLGTNMLVSFFAGTFLVEFLMNALGSLKVHRNKNSHFAFPTFRRRLILEEEVGHSKTQARHLVLVIASIVHAMYFVMMGSRSGFPVMFLAYVFSAFSRALLTGTQSC